MADVEKRTLEKIGKLHTKQRELQAQLFDVTEEIGRLLAGDAGIGAVLKELEQSMSNIWLTRYGTAYIWQYVKDRPNLKRLLKTLAPADIVERWAAYLRDDEAFYAKARHPFALFVTNINRYSVQGHATTAADLELEPPSDCRHTPRCKSDQEHTRRKSAEMRA